MALYHEHRPQSFETVLGQEHIIKTIENQIATDKVAHAYLFSGPRGVGKTTTARVLAKSLNCQNRKKGNFEPCNECGSCQEIAASRAIDVIEIDAASHTGVDNVRENIIDNAQFKPTSSRYKIFIIDEVHMLSTSAFNALLKTLEEPPAHVIFILATTEMQKLPETIVSRCQRFQFKKIPFAILSAHLLEIAKGKKVKLDDEVVERIVRKSDGCARDAVSILDQIMATGEKHITPLLASRVLPTSANEDVIRFVMSCLQGNVADGLTLVASLYDQGINMAQFLTDVAEVLRALLLKKAGQPGEPELDVLLPLASPAELLRLIDIVLKRKQEVRTAPIATLPAELVLFEWNERGAIPLPRPLTPERSDGERANLSTPKLTISEPKPEPDVKAKVEVKAETKPETVVETNVVSVSLDFIQKVWPEFLLKVEKTSPSLVFILKMAEIRKVDGNTALLAVQFGFHRDKIMDKSCQRQLEDLLFETAGTRVRLDVVVEPKEETAPPPEEALELASLLGGEVVS